MADHGYGRVYNYTPDLTEKFVKERPHDHITAYYGLQDFVSSLKRPCKIMFMIMAGKPVDSMIDQLIPLLDQGISSLMGAILILGIRAAAMNTATSRVSISMAWAYRAEKPVPSRRGHHARRQ